MPIKITGIREGRPDYSHDLKVKESVAILPAHVARPKVAIKCFERVFSDISSYFVAVRTPLAPGEEVPLMDVETGYEMPFTVPKGYYFEAKAVELVGDGPVRITIYVDEMLIAEYVLKSHQFHVETLPISFTTKVLDPEATSTHTMEVRIKNIGDTSFYGKCVYEAELVPKVIG
jgi:hypothetical protein